MKNGRWVGWLSAIGSAMVFVNAAFAEELVEDFPDPFGGWTQRWLYQNATIDNYYVATGDCNPDNRGNNPCGLWFTDCQGCNCGVGGNVARIEFKPEFGRTIQHIELDLSSWNATRLAFLDMDGNAVLDVVNPVRTANVCAGQKYGADSGNGISAIVVETEVNGQVEGNNAIDNVKVIVGGGTCSYTIQKSKAKGGCQACPERGENLDTETPCEDVSDCSKKVKTTINCPDGDGTCKIKAKRSSCG